MTEDIKINYKEETRPIESIEVCIDGMYKVKLSRGSATSTLFYDEVNRKEIFIEKNKIDSLIEALKLAKEKL